MKGKNLFAWTAGILFLGGIQTRPPGKTKIPQKKTVWVVMSGRAAPYRKAAEALEEKLEKGGIPTRRIELQSLREVWLSPTENRPAVCVAVGTKAALRLHGGLPEDILFSFCLVSHPGALGILKGRPFLGVTTDIPLPPQVALLRKALPWIRKVGLLYSGKDKASLTLRKELRSRLPKDWVLLPVDVEEFTSRAKAIETLLALRPDLIWTFPDPAVFDLASLRALLLGALRKKTPVLGFSTPLVRSGALLGPYLDPASQGAILAEKILKKYEGGTPSAQERALFFPEHLYALNLNVASRLGIVLSHDLVKKAKVVFGSRKDGRDR